MSHYTDPFAAINQQFEEKEMEQKPATDENAVEAYQIVRFRKMGIGTGSRREIIDTMYVKLGNSDLVRERAISKARMIGGCIVVEKSEKVITSFNE